MSKRETPVTGGETGIYDPEAARRGVFAKYPAMSPKYNTRPGHDEETMARLIIPIPATGSKAWDETMRTISSDDVVGFATALGYWGGVKEGSRAYYRGYIDFILQRAQESFQENFQAAEVQGDNYTTLFFGQKPPIFHYTGILLNTMQNDWRKAFTLVYLHLLRGTQLARRKLVMTLVYDEMAVTGSMINMSQIFTSDRQIASDFTFSVLVKKIQFDKMHSQPTRLKTNLPAYVRIDELMSAKVEDVKRTIRTGVQPDNARMSKTRASGKNRSPDEVNNLTTQPLDEYETSVRNHVSDRAKVELQLQAGSGDPDDPITE